MLPVSPLLSDADFAAMKARFVAAGDRLTDLQLLDLADCYHEMLRQRRAIRARHPAVAPARGSCIAPEARSFSPASEQPPAE
ncbi:hypothetical protein [Brevundimonas aurantiaca]|jgi:hypothetical protein|uniref:hypothetical protein n=1 Tax=Brevundimonas aurantiaca TaxID=74316 RepID=UPI0030197675